MADAIRLAQRNLRRALQRRSRAMKACGLDAHDYLCDTDAAFLCAKEYRAVFRAHVRFSRLQEGVLRRAQRKKWRTYRRAVRKMNELNAAYRAANASCAEDREARMADLTRRKSDLKATMNALYGPFGVVIGRSAASAGAAAGVVVSKVVSPTSMRHVRDLVILGNERLEEEKAEIRRTHEVLYEDEGSIIVGPLKNRTPQ